MLLCVCLNPAVDVTYQLSSALVPGETHRVTSVAERAGGKAVNVARVALALGQAVTVLAPVGGAAGAFVRADLAAAGVRARLVEVAGTTRRTLAVVSPVPAGAGATLLNEPGPEISADEWNQLLAAFSAMLPAAGLVVASGSLPPGIPPEAYATLVRLAGSRNVPMMVDAEGGALRAALPERPFLVKPNLAELASVVGPFASVEAGARELRDLGAQNVAVSLGADGLLAVTADGSWRASGPAVGGNPTGAGDALVAALAVGVLSGQPWPERLRSAVACSAAAVASPVAGEVDPSFCLRLLDPVQVRAG